MAGEAEKVNLVLTNVLLERGLFDPLLHAYCIL